MNFNIYFKTFSYMLENESKIIKLIDRIYKKINN